MAKTRAQENRAIRQEGLREVLSKQKHIEQVIKNIKKMEGLDISKDTFNNSLNKLKIANEHRMRLINKYLPDLKNTEITGDAGGAIQITEVTRTIIRSGEE